MSAPEQTIFTVGFTRKNAREFFEKLRCAGVRRILDVRLNNVSQLAGFSKRDDLQYFSQTILGAEYHHLPLLAPTDEMLAAYKKNKGTWETYERAFLDLMSERKIEDQLDPALFSGGCLLCSEDQPHHCHRRLVAEYLQAKWGRFAIQHLV